MNANQIFQVALRNFLAGQRLSREELGQLQARKIREVLQAAIAWVPLYRDLYGRLGVDIREIQHADDLWRLPTVSKEDYLQQGPSRYVDERFSLAELGTQTTSGSLGRSLTMYASPSERLRLSASLWSAWLDRGITSADRLLMMSSPYLARPMIDVQTDFIPVQTPTEEIVERFRALRPTAIIGPGESISLLAREVGRRDLPERLLVRSLFPFGQTFTEQMRAMVRQGFAGEIFVLYGAAETNWLAYECERHDGLHLAADRVVVQVARRGQPNQPADPGEVGEVIVTSLMRRTNPFIRYRLGDAAALDLSPCPCGRAAPRLQSLEGRFQDFLVATHGTWVAPSAIAIDLIVGQKAILDYRIVQESRDQVRVSVCATDDFGDGDRRRAEDILRRHLGEVRVIVEVVAEIPRDPSGKRRRVFRSLDLP